MKYFAITDKGAYRRNNQDAFLIAQTLCAEKDAFSCESPPGSVMETTLLAAIADGMGGHADGEIASRIALEFISVLNQPGAGPLGTPFLKNLVRDAHLSILQAGRERRSNMGTTLTGALFTPEGQAWVFNAGDSQTWRFADGELEKITVDHNQAEVEHNPLLRHILTSCLGGGQGDFPHVDIFEAVWNPGDLFLLNSDGLVESLTPAELRLFLEKDLSLAAKGRALVDLSYQKGSSDNVTLVLVQF